MQQKQNNHILSQQLFSPSVVSDSLQLHGLQHTRLPCPSSGACSNSCPSSQWSHPTISSSVAPFSSCSNQQWGKSQSNPIYTLKLLIVTAVCDTIISEGRGENTAKIRKVLIFWRSEGSEASPWQETTSLLILPRIGNISFLPWEFYSMSACP